MLKYLKCSCHLCGGHIEFPTELAGSAINCPHCEKGTILSAPNPPLIPIAVPHRNRSHVKTAAIVAGVLVPYALLLIVLPVLLDSRDSSQTRHKADLESDLGLLPPLTNYEAKAEPIEPIPRLEMSKDDIADFREWMAAGAPKYWKGKDQFPEMSREQWERWRKSTREHLEQSTH